MQYFDAHIHLLDLCNLNQENFNHGNTSFLASCHSKEDIDFADKLISQGWQIVKSFGIHPWNLDYGQIPYLENLIQQRQINAIGEFGLDYYKPQKEPTEKQKYFFELQLELAAYNNLPAIFHLRKSLQDFFGYTKELRKLPAIILHSYSGTAEEANYLLKSNINAFFSFGTPIINENKKGQNALEKIPTEHILLETDAPYQPVKNEAFTTIGKIADIYIKAAEIKKTEPEKLAQIIIKTKEKLF